MSKYFDYFPKIAYDISKSNYSTYQNPTNIFFRVAVIKEALENISSYYLYSIKESDKPETLADQVYGSPEAHWIILMANDIHDPLYDWPLKYDDFNKHIADKYRITAGGSNLTDSQVIAWAQNTTPNSNSIHHYEKVIDRTDVSTETTTTFRYVIDYTMRSNTAPSGVVYDYYTSLSNAGDYSTYSTNGVTVREKIYRSFVTVYDYEMQQNENKRNIKIIKPDYYGRIAGELQNLTGSNKTNRRNLV